MTERKMDSKLREIKLTAYKDLKLIKIEKLSIFFFFYNNNIYKNVKEIKIHTTVPQQQDLVLQGGN